MKFAKYTFWLIGIYGFLLLTPMYFFEKQISLDYPPAITHPEYFYGFIGAMLTWHIGFFLIGSDPLRYRPLMLPAALGKFVYSTVILILFFGERVPSLMLVFAIIDAIFGILSLVSDYKSNRFNCLEYSTVGFCN